MDRRIARAAGYHRPGSVMSKTRATSDSGDASVWKKAKGEVILDASAPETFETARNELHGLLKRETLGGIPLLVLGNKCDLEASVRVQEVVEAMELKRATGREVCCYNVSCKDKTNLSVCLKWLTAHAK